MIRFAWLQFRTQAIAALVGLGAVAIVLGVTGPHIVDLYRTTVATCHQRSDCSTATADFTDTDGPIQVFMDFAVLLVPVLIGMFWGAPLVAREFENGTYPLAWTQGVTRTRWLVIKLGLGMLAAVTVAGVLSAMVTWWSSLFDLVRAYSFDPLTFGVRDLTPLGYAAFAFALGVAAGLFTRRTLPAMVTVLVGFAAVRYAVTAWVRPRLISPLHTTLPVNGTTVQGIGRTQAGTVVTTSTRGILPGSWPYSAAFVSKTGKPPSTAFFDRACPVTHPNFSMQECLANVAKHFHVLVAYQPESRYWAFQWYETAIYCGLALALAGLCVWQIRRRIA